jgi:hypothetical protein
VALVNGDGYWTRASDFSLFRDPEGRFHTTTHDANETFSGSGFGPGPAFAPAPPPPPPPPARGVALGGFVITPLPPGANPQRGGGRGGFAGPGGADLDPLVGLEDATKPLRSKLLAVPALRERYLGYVRDIATKWLDWQRLGPVAEGYHALIAADVKADTRKLDTYAAFEAGLPALKAFVERRRAVLLKDGNR